MAFSRMGNRWPSGARSWYIYASIYGGLYIYPDHEFNNWLAREDVVHLRDILNEYLERYAI